MQRERRRRRFRERVCGKGSCVRSRATHGGVALGKRSLVAPGQMSKTKGLWGKELQEMDRGDLWDSGKMMGAEQKGVVGIQ